MGRLTEDFIKRPPAVFPLVLVFHLIMLLISFFNAIAEQGSFIIWIDVVWMLLYTTSWAFTCLLRKWALVTYLVLTATNLVLYLVFRNDPSKQVYISSLFLLDILFSFFLLGYRKRFD